MDVYWISHYLEYLSGGGLRNACQRPPAPGIITTKYMESNLLNGGAFGIEGGILTTIMTLLSFLFVWYYYRNSNYDFLSDKEKQETLR